MSLSRPLKSLKIRLFSTFQILENCYQIRKKTLTVWKFQTIKVILYSKLHFMFSHDFFISLAESFALKLDKTVCPEICGVIGQSLSFCFRAKFLSFRVHKAQNFSSSNIRNCIQTFFYILIASVFRCPHKIKILCHFSDL